MVAGFLAGCVRGFSEEEAFRLAVAAGSATAFCLDLAGFREIEELYKKVKIKKLA